MSVSVSTIGQALTRQQVESYYNSIGNISYTQLKQTASRLFGMTEDTFEVWLGWLKGEGYEFTNGVYEGYLTQSTATNLYQMYTDHTASGLANRIRGGDPTDYFTEPKMRARAREVEADQVTFQRTIRCAFLALSNPDQRCYSCYGGVDGPIIASWFDGSHMIYSCEDPTGVKHYPYVQNGGVFGAVAMITFTQRNRSPEGENNPCYLTNGAIIGDTRYLGTVANNSWNTCIKGSPILNGATALSDCTGYAQGRALEIYNECMNYNPNTTLTHPFMGLNQNAGEWYDDAQEQGLPVNPTVPGLGSIMCWGEYGSAGHVAVVEEIVDTNTIITTESAYDGFRFSQPSPYWARLYRYRNYGTGWGSDWFPMIGYYFRGFILNPANPNMPFPEPDPIEEAKKSKMWMYLKRRDLRPQYRQNL